MLDVIGFEIPVSRLVKVYDDRHDLADAELPCSTTLSTSIGKQFLFPIGKKDLAKIIYTHK